MIRKGRDVSLATCYRGRESGWFYVFIDSIPKSTVQYDKCQGILVLLIFLHLLSNQNTHPTKLSTINLIKGVMMPNLVSFDNFPTPSHDS